jgi:hypothetical protein
MPKIGKSKPKAKEAPATMTKIAKAKPKAKEAKEAPAKKIQIHDPKKEVRISRSVCRYNALAKMMHITSGRPAWSCVSKSLLWVKKGSRNHKLAMRGENVKMPGSHTVNALYYRYALGWRNNM